MAPAGDDRGDGPRWLSPAQQRAWRALIPVLTRLPASLDTQLQRDAGLTHFDFTVLATLSEAPGRRVKLRDLAEYSAASLSRLSHVVTKLERLEWVRRESVEGGRGSFAVLTDAGFAKLESAAPGHAETVHRLVFDGLTDSQVTELESLGLVLVDQIDRTIAQGLRP